MDVKELIEQFDNFIGNAELGEKEGQSVEDFQEGLADGQDDYEEDDELGLYIINDGDMYRKYSQPAQDDIRAGKEADWEKIAKIGSGKYCKEIEKRDFSDEEIKKTAEYIKDYYERDLKESLSPAQSLIKEYFDDEEENEYEIIFDNLVNGNLSDYREKLKELQDKGELRYYADYCQEMGWDPQIEKWADNRDGNPEEEDYEYIYSSLVNGNISQYKNQLKRLQKNGQLRDYKAFCDEMGVDPRVGRFLESVSKSAELIEQYEANEGLGESKSREMNEISLELADEVSAKRQMDVLKAELSGDEEALEQAEKKANKNIELAKKWKKAKGINEEVVAKYDEGKHEIVKCDKGYYNRYNIKEGKATFTSKCVESLPTAITALKRRFPQAEEVK